MRTMLDRYEEKTGRYDKFQATLDEAYQRQEGTCYYCPTKLTTDPFKCSRQVKLAHFHHDIIGAVRCVCRLCHERIHG